MLLVRSSIHPSGIHGIGCFTDEPIARDQLVWTFDERIDSRIPEADLADLPPPVREFLAVYGYAEIFEGQRVIVLCGDHSKYMNHSDSPNLASTGPDNVAARDIQAGEELTCDYFSFDLDAALRFS